MSTNRIVNASEEEARALAEESRQTSWKGRSFLRELFLGELRVDWIDPWPETPERPEFTAFMGRLEAFMKRVDSAEIEALGAYPQSVVEGLRELGAFGLKIPKQYGGVGLTQVEYCRACELVASYDGNVAALVSAHNSIGVPQPLYLFGTDAQKEKYLTQCANGGISAFALTEPDVGSDPARLATIATKTPDGNYEISGEKLWITNGTIADLMVVMARDAETQRISAFVVETAWEGVSVGHHCRFMGLKALANGVIKLDRVKVPAANRIGKDGEGLKIALVTLNTGRLSLPAACVGGARRCVEWARDFAAERVQWGAPVGQHEAISHKLADIAATTYAMESWSRLAAELSMREGYDIRLEAAAAKEWASVKQWDVIDTTLQIRGGRGYETETSLAGRGEKPFPVERMMRDSRINRIFEGSSEIMHLFMAREMLDKHLQVAKTLVDDPKATTGDKIKALPGVLAFYARWYPKLWWSLPTFFRYGQYGELGKHLRYAEHAARRLARTMFHGMVRYQAGMAKKQAFMFRTVDIAMEIAVMTAAVVRTHHLQKSGAPHASEALALTDQHCRNATALIEERFHALWNNDDAAKYATGRAVLEGRHAWMESPAYADEGELPAREESTAAK
ncbi:MAG: acyl-CoA dehydrogenase family protein [Alphaproteobacteria bacterium]|nr:acyl-CoA dehydrogenase family protein [Alphaproteobacteria bacterium]